MQKVDDSDSDFKEVEAVNGADGASPPEEGPATTEVSPLAQAWKLKVEQDAEQQPDAEEAPGNVEEAPEPAAAEDGEKPKYDALHGTGDPADLYTEVQKAVASGDPFALASAICTWAPAYCNHPRPYLRVVAQRAKQLAPGLNINDFIAEMEKARKKYQKIMREDGTSQLSAKLFDAPGSVNTVAPTGWSVSQKGVVKQTDKGEIIACPVPAVIEKIQRRMEDGQEHWTVAWLDPVKKRWRSIAAGREVFASRNAVVALAGNGLPVNTSTAPHLVDYLSAFERANADHLQISEAVGHCGWASDDRFVLGKTSINASGAAQVEFFAESAGEEQYVNNFITAGSETEWSAVAAEVVAKYPKVAVMLYGSLGSVLLKILGVNSFVLHLWDDTSSGKSTAEEFAMSPWGDPHSGHLLRTWETTVVAVERLAFLNNDLPLGLDEAQEALPDQLSRLVYLISGGSGRGRGAKRGLQAHAMWHTICLSAGERALHTACKFKGAGVRVLTIYGSPFDSRDQQEFVRKVRSTVYQHHGHAGPRFVRAVLENQGEWGEWKKQYEEAVARWSSVLGGSTGSRRAQFIALLEVAGGLCHRFLGLPGDAKANVVKAMESLVSEGTEANYARDAFDAAYQFAVTNQTSFVGKERTDGFGKIVQPNRYLGVWKTKDLIAFMPEPLETELKRLGYEFETALRGWNAAGWLKREGSNLRVKVKMPDDSRPRMLVVGIKEDGEPRVLDPNEAVFERQPGED